MLTVVCLMLTARLPAGAANPCAQRTKFLGEHAFSCHQGGRQLAHICAIPVQPDAVSHHFYVLLSQAG